MKSLQEQLENQKLITQMDIILKWFYEGNKLELVSFHDDPVYNNRAVYLASNEFIDTEDISRICEYLRVKSLIRQHNCNKGVVKINNSYYVCVSWFQITFDGRIFLENGGFTGEQNKETRQERFIKIQTNTNIILAILPLYSIYLTFVDFYDDGEFRFDDHVILPVCLVILAYLGCKTYESVKRKSDKENNIF